MARAWAVDIRSARTGRDLYELNAGKLMMPASNMKILTLAATADALGWDYRFTTTLETRGTVTDGVLHGDFIVRGNGDPSINARDGRADGGVQRVDARAAGGRHLCDRRPYRRRRSGVRRRGDRGRAGRGITCSPDMPRRSARSRFNENLAALTICSGASGGRTGDRDAFGQARGWSY